jgi:hypothetical protein
MEGVSQDSYKRGCRCTRIPIVSRKIEFVNQRADEEPKEWRSHGLADEAKSKERFVIFPGGLKTYPSCKSPIRSVISVKFSGKIGR